jgi:hypothetical protein
VNAHFSYQFDQEGESFEEKEEQTGVTLSNITPTFSFIDVIAGQEDIVFEYTITDTDVVGSLTKIELLKGTEVIETLTEFDSTMFEGLLSNNDYQLRATYTYDLNDGEGLKTIVATSNTKTLAKGTPTYTIFDASSTSSSVTFDIDELDTYDIGEITKIELYIDTTLIDTLNFIDEEWPNMFLFEDLEQATLYKIIVNFEYDLNDSLGVNFDTIEFTIPTKIKDLNVSNISILNPTTPKIGEDVSIRISLNNPLLIKIESILVNNVNYSLVGFNSTTSIILKLPADIFSPGSYVISIEGFNYVLFERTINHQLFEPYNKNLTILGDLSVLDVSFTNGDYTLQGEIIDLFLSLDNKTMYTINSVDIIVNHNKLNYDAIFIQDNLIKVQLINLELGLITITIDTIYFSFDQTNDSVFLNKSYRLFVAESIVNITTANELKTMNHRSVYLLNNDIDLSDVLWSPYDFIGYLDGNGFKISNLTLINSNSSSTSFGLFNNNYGMIYRTKLLDTYISIYSIYDLNVGMISGNNYGIVSFSLTTGIMYSSSQTNVINIGGIVGTNGGLVQNSFSQVDINASSTGAILGNNHYGGGGAVGMNYGTVDNVFSQANIQSNLDSVTNIGFAGLVGFNYGKIFNSGAISIMTISGNFATIGGLVGQDRGTTLDSAYVSNIEYSSGNYYSNINDVNWLDYLINNNWIIQNFIPSLVIPISS